MSDLNNLSLMGRVVRDAEMKVTASGVKVTVFSVATNRTRKDESGNYTDEGHFFPLAVYGNYAEKMLPRLKKGQRVVIEGFVRQDRWVTGDGQKRSATGIGAGRFTCFLTRGKLRKENRMPRKPSRVRKPLNSATSSFRRFTMKIKTASLILSRLMQTERFSDEKPCHSSIPKTPRTLPGAKNGMSRAFSRKTLHAAGCGCADNSWDGFLFRDKLSFQIQPLELLALEEPCRNAVRLFRHDSCGNKISIEGNVR